jgi:hypothetical protein
MNSPYRTPEALLEELRITEPEEIDVEAIAYYCGAVVKYRPLTGCAARIVGAGDKAIITVDSESLITRQRFSIGHELGHWMRDRGRAAFMCKDRDFYSSWAFKGTPEAIANRYAADLLMPISMFRVAAGDQPITFETVSRLAERFRVSKTAAAIRLVEIGTHPAMIVCFGKAGRKWFQRGPDVPDVIWPKDQLDHDTAAFDLLFANKEQNDADSWINHARSDRYTVVESSIKTSEDSVVSLIWWKDESQLVDLE